jgi:hypothetical protein
MLGTLERASAIVVEVEPAAPTCFVIIPFDEYYDTIYDAITRAATNVNLLCLRTKDKPGLDFTVDIDKMLRYAALVVAVCVRRPEDKYFNPNVMYELGKAHALGKPTIIVASENPRFPDTNISPSDIAEKHFVKFALADDSKGYSRDHINSFRIEIENRMRALRERANTDLVDLDWSPDIHVVHPRYKMCLKQEFFTCFTRIVGFGERLHHIFLPVDNVLSHLERLVAEISQAFPDTHQLYIEDFINAWNEKNQLFSRANQYISSTLDTAFFSHESHSAVHNRRGVVQEAFSDLTTIAQESEAVKRCVSSGFQLFGYINDDIKKYKTIYRDLLATKNDSFDVALRDRNKAGLIWEKISDLSRITTTLVSRSHGLVSTMIDPFI